MNDPTSHKPKRLQYKNGSRKELVFSDGSYVIYENLPLDHMKLFGKELVITKDAIYYKTFQLAAVCPAKRVTWVDNVLFKFPITE